MFVSYYFAAVVVQAWRIWLARVRILSYVLLSKKGTDDDYINGTQNLR